MYEYDRSRLDQSDIPPVPFRNHRYIIGGTNHTEGLEIINELDLLSDFGYFTVDNINVLDYPGDLDVDGTKVLEKIQ